MKTRITILFTCLAFTCKVLATVSINGLSYNFNETDKTATLISYDLSAGTDLVIPDTIAYNNINYVVTAIAGTNSQITSITLHPTIKSITATFTSNTLKAVYWKGEPEEWCRLSFSSYKRNPLNVARKLYDKDGHQITKIDLSNQGYAGKYSLYNAEVDTLVFGTYYYYEDDEILSGWKGNTVLWNVISCDGWGGDIGPFKNCRSNITTFVFGDSVVDIPQYLCTGMRIQKVRIPAKVESIGYYAFEGCSYITEIEYNSRATHSIWSTSVTGDGPFSSARSSVKTVIVGDSVTHIQSLMFNGLSALTELTLPKTITSISSKVFNGCSSLRRINYDGTIEDWHKIYFGDLTANPLYYAGYIYTNDIAWNNVSLPEGITELKSVSFANAKFLTDSLCMPETVSSIGNYALYGCNSHIVTLPASIKSIGENAFSQCYALNKVYYQGTASQWASIRFYNAAANPISNSCNLYIANQQLEDAYIDTLNVTNYSFYNCQTIKRLILGESVQQLGSSAFAKCSSLSFIKLSTNIQYVNKNCFESCTGVDSIEYSCKDLTYVENAPFKASAERVSHVNISNGVEKIPPYLFCQMNKISEIRIPNSVITIGKSAFESCAYVRQLSIGSSISSIKALAFKDCIGLLSVNSQSMLPAIIDSTTFKNVSKTIKITIPCGTIGNYHAAQYWNLFNNFIEDLPFDIDITSEDKLKGYIKIISEASCSDDVVTFEAVPRNGYIFEKWSDNSTENPRSMIVESDIRLIAYFKADGVVGVDNVYDDIIISSKIVRNGQLFILRDGKTFTVQGQEVK